MPTILEHLAALFDKDMRAVLNNPRAISMIANPSARVQMAAVRRDRSVICFIERPTEKVQLTAVRNAPHNIHSSLRQVRGAADGHRQQAFLYRLHPKPYGKSTAESRREETGMHLPAAEARRKGATDGRPERSPVSLGNQGADRKVQLAAVQKIRNASVI